MFDTLVVTSGTRWEEPPRIRHQITQEMKKYFDKVLFVEMPRYLRYPFEEKKASAVRQVDDNIFALRVKSFLTLPKNGHAIIPFISESEQKRTIGQIEKALCHIQGKEAFLFNFTYSNYLIQGSNLFSLSVFVLNDDFIGKAPNRLVFSLAKRLQNKTARNADLCLAVSTPLLEQVKKINKNSVIFLPGHSFDARLESRSIKTKDKPYVNKQKHKVAFMGYIDRRLEVEWVKFAAEQKDIDFYLLGPNTLESKTIAELEKSGVQILQPLIGSDLEKFLQSCDVLTMPYVLNKVTIAGTAPNKLFQYIAAGRPIVSSALPHLLEFPPYVLRKAHNKEDFVRKIYEAVEMDSEEHVKERLRIASENTWEKRGKELINLIERGIRVREQGVQR